MGRTLMQKILYKRRKFVTKKRIKSAIEIAATLLPAVISTKPGLASLSGVLDALLQQVNNDPAVPTADATSKRLRQRIKELKAQLGTTQDTAEAAKLRQKLDNLYDLLDDTQEETHE
jgi:hypothetical protein